MSPGLLQGRSSLSAAGGGGEHPEQHNPGAHSREDSGPPTRAGRSRRRARLNEPSGSRAARGSPRKGGEPPLPFLRRGIIAAHDAAGVIAAGVIAAGPGASAQPPGTADNSICPSCLLHTAGGSLLSPCSAQGTPSGRVSQEGGDVGHWGSLPALRGRSVHPPTLI